MKQMLEDCGITQKELIGYCNNTSAIDISNNPVQHSRMKHIDIKHHFIRELIEEQIVLIKYVPTQRQLANIFIKSLDATWFEELRNWNSVYFDINLVISNCT
jgi:hypothetical protein